MHPLQPVLEAQAITKSYGHVRALRGVDFDLRCAEVHALVGDNGAGKSTLIMILVRSCRRRHGYDQDRG